MKEFDIERLEQDAVYSVKRGLAEMLRSFAERLDEKPVIDTKAEVRRLEDNEDTD